MACENSQSARIYWTDSEGKTNDFYSQYPPASYLLTPKNTGVKYQYPGEAQQTILGADSYTVQQQPPPFIGGQCPNVQYKVRVRVKGATTHPFWATNFGCNVSIVWTSIAYNGKIKNVIQKPDNRVWVEYVHPTLGEIENLFALENNATNGLTARDNCISTNNPYSYLRNTLEILGVIRADGQPDNCGDLASSCDFKAYKQGQLVHSETRSVCPTVSYIQGCDLNITDNRGLVFTEQFTGNCPTVRIECDDECPPNTCEVDCRGHKCCYNAQGQVVKVIN